VIRLAPPNNSIDIDTGATDRCGSTDTQGTRVQTERAWDEDVTPNTLITDEYAPLAVQVYNKDKLGV
jgi:hypothetical protein